MSRLSVQGYHNGVSMVLVADDTEDPHPVHGVVTQATAALLAALDAASGRTTTFGGTGAEVTASLDSIEGVLAALACTPQVEITGLDGDLPPTYPGAEAEDERPGGEVVH